MSRTSKSKIGLTKDEENGPLVSIEIKGVLLPWQAKAIADQINSWADKVEIERKNWP